MKLHCVAIIASFIFCPAHISAESGATADCFNRQVPIRARFDSGFESLELKITAAGAPAQNDERININTASAEELERLPGIGPALASRIVEHRRKHGRFKRPQDIVIVRGMSAKLYRRIARLIRT
jgi:competence ComEA-like helix-hairpin-helix protein